MTDKSKFPDLNKTIPFPKFKPPISLLGVFFYTQKELEEKNRQIEKYNQHQAGRIALVRFMKLFDLLDHYEIDKTNSDCMWMMLAYKLAVQHEPSFQVEKAKRGRPSKWDDGDLFGIYCTVNFIKFNNSISNDSHACKIALQNHLKIHFPKLPLKTLQNKYIDSKNSNLVKMHNHFFEENSQKWKDGIMFGFHTYLSDLKNKVSQ